MGGREFRPMGIGDILDTSIRLYKGNFVRFLGVAAVVWVPLALLLAWNQSAMRAAALAAREAGPGAGASGMFGGMLLVLVSIGGTMLGTMLVNASLIKTVSESYLGRSVGIAETYSFVGRRFGTVVLAAILSTLVILGGYVLLIVPGVLFSLWLAFVTQVVVVEGTGARTALKRSWAIASGNLGKIFVLGLVLSVVGLVIGTAVSWASQHIVQGPGAGAAFLTTLIGQAGSLFIQPFVSGCWILLYYDLRIRKEGFDLEMMAQSLSSAAPEQTPA